MLDIFQTCTTESTRIGTTRCWAAVAAAAAKGWATASAGTRRPASLMEPNSQMSRDARRKRPSLIFTAVIGIATCLVLPSTAENAVLGSGSGKDASLNNNSSISSGDVDAKATHMQRTVPVDGDPACSYTKDLDYVGSTSHLLGRSNASACCAACVANPKCEVAVLSSTEDSPPQECWLKFGAVAQVQKPGVWACKPTSRKLQLVQLLKLPDHPSQYRNRRRDPWNHRRYRPVPLTPSQRALQKKASGTLLILLMFMVGGQFLIFYWKKNHYRSFMYVTLAGLWLFPFAWSTYYHWWRFVTLSGAFTLTTGYFVYIASRVPLDVRAPRRVYWWFNRMYALCLGLGFFGYILLVVEMTGFRAAVRLHRFFAEVATLSLFYALYFGVLSRDLAEICSWKMTQTMGYVKKDDDEPQRLLPANTCALCGEDLNPDLEHLIEGQDYAITDYYVGAAGRGRRGRRGRIAPPMRGIDPPERGGGMSEALRPERIVKLKCGHEFHEFCVRGWTIVGKQAACPNCGEKVDIHSVLGSSPWEKNPNMIWGQLLDALRYMIVWNPVIMLGVRFSVYEVETHGGF